jgi:ATP-dependent DNA ligase
MSPKRSQTIQKKIRRNSMRDLRKVGRVYPSPRPASAARPPAGSDWLHEPKWDGFRFQVIKDGRNVRLYSKSGAEYSSELPGMHGAGSSP